MIIPRRCISKTQFHDSHFPILPKNAQSLRSLKHFDLKNLIGLGFIWNLNLIKGIITVSDLFIVIFKDFLVWWKIEQSQWSNTYNFRFDFSLIQISLRQNLDVSGSRTKRRMGPWESTYFAANKMYWIW